MNIRRRVPLFLSIFENGCIRAYDVSGQRTIMERYAALSQGRVLYHINARPK